MLNVFPSLLTYTFFAPTLLRLGVALILLWSAWQALRHRHRRAALPFHIFENAPWIPYVAALAEAALAAMFIAGWYTQIAALLGIAGALKYAIYRRWWPSALEVYFPISPGAAFLMFVICLSLLISGAGAVAFDLPL